MLGRSLLKFRPVATLGRLGARMPSIVRAAAPVRAMSNAAYTYEYPVVPSPAPAKPSGQAAGEELATTILGRGYEMYPVIGMGLTVAITQEYWIMDEWVITGACFAGVLYTAYVLGRDKVIAWHAKNWKDRITRGGQAMGIYYDNLKRYELLEEFSLSHAEELRNLYAEEAKINSMAIEYQNLKHKADTRTAILQKLKSVEQLEDDTRRTAIVALSTKAAEYVTKAYKSAPDAVKQRQIESGIARIVPELSTRSIASNRGKTKALARDDPVKLLFDEFLSQPRTFAQLGVENYVQRFMDRHKAAAAAKH